VDSNFDEEKMSYRNNSSGLGIVAYLIITCVAIWVGVSITFRSPFQLGLLGPLQFIPSDLLHLERPWTVITSIFVHSPWQVDLFYHILFNMITLYFFGTFLVNLIGERFFLLVFLLGGIVGNLFFMLIPPNYGAVIGASGAIYALGGTLVAMRPRLQVIVFPIPIPMPLWVSVLGGFILTYFLAGVAWQAHLGGLVFGLLAGLFFRYRETHRIF
jgi:membrane associated rhomboid family serine protease